MRLVLVAALLLSAACGSSVDTPPLVGDDDLAMPNQPDLQLPPECPSGFQSPVYCFSGALGTATPCGSCATIGERCDYFEASLTCACDHQWRCSYAGGSSGGCQTPDGGVVCN